jgi:hypothetical protein
LDLEEEMTMQEPIMSSMEAIDRLLRAWDLEAVVPETDDGSGKKELIHKPTGRKLRIAWLPEEDVEPITDPEVIMFREMTSLMFQLLTRPQPEIGEA